MTATLISLISILIGILGALGIGSLFKKYSAGFIGNTLAGVFGSILFIKSLGRLGFTPQDIVYLESVHSGLFALNLLISFLGGTLGVILIHTSQATNKTRINSFEISMK
jgi:small basic protein